MQKRTIFFFLAILIVIGGIFYFSTKSRGCFRIQCLGFPDKETWKIKEIYEDSGKSWRVLFENSGGFVKLEKYIGISPKTSDSLTKSRLMQVQGLYDKSRSPYPGAISDEIVCNEKYKPEEKELISNSGIKVSYFHEFLNNRFVAGACQEREIDFDGYTALFYCQSTSEWYQIEIISPKISTENEERIISDFKEIKCQRPSMNIGKLLP